LSWSPRTSTIALPHSAVLPHSRSSGLSWRFFFDGVSSRGCGTAVVVHADGSTSTRVSGLLLLLLLASLFCAWLSAISSSEARIVCACICALRHGQVSTFPTGLQTKNLGKSLFGISGGCCVVFMIESKCEASGLSLGREKNTQGQR
jgi:hypothetical protein